MTFPSIIATHSRRSELRTLAAILITSAVLAGYLFIHRSTTASVFGFSLELSPALHDLVEDLDAQGANFRNALPDNAESLPAGTVVNVQSAMRNSSSSPSSAYSSLSRLSQENSSLSAEVQPLPTTSVTVSLTRNDGVTYFPHYHFTPGSAEFTLDERQFRPGYYTLRIASTDGRYSEQDFAWGVLTLNTHQDRYRTNERAQLHFGVLDDQGEIVCNANVMLTIIAPDGSRHVLSTEDESIETTESCGVKEAGLIDPDYRASFLFTQEGEYALQLQSIVAERTTTLTSSVSVQSSPSVIITRRAATRLWPFAPSRMEIDVEFTEEFTGTISDIVPRGFAILQTSPQAVTGTDFQTEDTTIAWNGTWNKGEKATFSYIYDAPDISPEFYLVGPLILIDTRGIESQEMRAWQIANDAAQKSANYKIDADVIASGGGELALSNNYRLSDTIGEPGVGFSRAQNYDLSAGYRQAASNALSLVCFTALNLGSIPGIGQTTAEESCTVIAESDAGYSLSWLVSTGSGGTATGHMISQFEDTIGPFSPSVVGVPETWTVAATTSEWGGRLKSSSTDSAVQWGTDLTSEKWLNVGTGSSVLLVNRNSSTAPAGSSEQLQFRAEVGSSKIQPSGTYDVTVDFIVTSP